MNRLLSALEPTIRPAIRDVALVALAFLISCGSGDPPGLAFHRGLNAVEDERFDLARTHFERELQQRPEHLEALRQLCLAWRRGANQALVPSLDLMQRYLRLEPSDQAFLRRLIETHLMLGQVEAAAGQLDALDDSPAAWTLRAKTLLDLDLGAADWAISRALVLDSGVPAIHLVAADIARKAGDRDRERHHLREAVLLDPLNDQARYRFGRAVLLQGDRAAGTSEIEIAGQLTELRAALASKGGAGVAALRILESLDGEIDFAHPRVATTRARLLLEAGRDEEGIELLSALESVHSLSVPEQVVFASLLARRGQSAEALDRFEGLLAADPSLRSVRLVLARLHRARGETVEAETLLRDGLSRESFVAHFHAELGSLALADGRVPAAKEAYRTALQLAPWTAQWRVELARIEIAEGRLDEAGRILAAAPEPSQLIERLRSQHGLDPSTGRTTP